MKNDRFYFFDVVLTNMLHFAPQTLTRQKVKLHLRKSVTLSSWLLLLLKLAKCADKESTVNTLSPKPQERFVLEGPNVILRNL